MKTTKFAVGIGIAMAAALAGAQDVKAALEEKVTNAGDKMAVMGQDGWLFFVPELRYLAAGPFWGANAATASHALQANAKDPLPAILDFKAQLDKKGITLLFVPVPAKAAIYGDKLDPRLKASDASRVDAAQAEFLALLKKNGVRTIDLTPVFLKARAAHPDQDLYCKTDTHWSGYGLAAAADAISAQIRSLPLGLVKRPMAGLQVRPLSVQVTGDLASMLDNVRLKPETIRLTSVVGPTINRTSPVLLLGDSHNLVFSQGEELFAKGAGFPENLSARLGLPVDVVAVRGSGATPARTNLLRRGDNLAGKKVVVWVFTAREFTEGQGWKKVQVIRN